MQQTANTNLEQELKEMKETNRDTPRVSDTKNDTFSNQTLVTSNPRQDIPDRNNTKKRKFRLFSCPDCDKSFTQQAHLSIHERKHTGERPYICGFAGCSKSFTQLGNLKTHERKHTGERPFQCSHPGNNDCNNRM